MRIQWIRGATTLSLALTTMLLPVIGITSGLSTVTRSESALFIENFNYADRVYAESKKTELGDQVEMDMAVKYLYDQDLYGMVSFQTDPTENRYDNKTSKLELLLFHRYAPFSLQLDSELNSDDGSTGGRSIGLDLDSEKTFITYHHSPHWALTFYPFNFDGEVGHNLQTLDVTRLHSLTGAPSSINHTQIGDEKFVNKTIPGLELQWMPSRVPGLKLSTSYGVASSLYPANSDFNLETNPNADRWERREDIGYKFALDYQNRDLTAGAQYVAHTNSEYTGSLLAAAASIYGSYNWRGRVTVDGEVTWSKAGSAPLRLNRSGEWFETTTPFQPVYSDYYGDRQDWIDQLGRAAYLKVGFPIKTTTPYLSAKYLDSNFIYRERESAHLLRTADESSSHGGLVGLGVGVIFKQNRMTITPQLEWLRAQNPVFSNSSDVRQDRFLSRFKKEDYLLTINVSYNLGDS